MPGPLAIAAASAVPGLIEGASTFARRIVDAIWPPQADPNKKLEAEVALAAAVETGDLAYVQAGKEIIVAEMQQGDPYTKKARPTLVYAGLFFIFLVHVALPMWAFYAGKPIPELSLPEEFWYAWASVVGIWSLGRTFERDGSESKLISKITGKYKLWKRRVDSFFFAICRRHKE